MEKTSCPNGEGQRVRNSAQIQSLIVFHISGNPQHQRGAVLQTLLDGPSQAHQLSMG